MKWKRPRLAMALVFVMALTLLATAAQAAPVAVSGLIDDGVSTMLVEAPNGRLMLVSGGTLYTSADRGRNWTQQTVISDRTGTACIAGDASNNFYVLYAASPTSGMYRWRVRKLAWNGTTWALGSAVDVSSDWTVATDCAITWDAKYSNVHLAYGVSWSATAERQIYRRAYRVAQNTLTEEIYLATASVRGSSLSVLANGTTGDVYTLYMNTGDTEMPLVLHTAGTPDGSRYYPGFQVNLCRTVNDIFPPPETHLCEPPVHASATLADDGRVVVAVTSDVQGMSPYMNRGTLSVLAYDPASQQTAVEILTTGVAIETLPTGYAKSYRPAITNLNGDLYLFYADQSRKTYYRWQKNTGRWTGGISLPFASSFNWPMKSAPRYYSGIWVAWQESGTQRILVGSLLAPDAPQNLSVTPVPWWNLTDYRLGWTYSNPNSDDTQAAYRVTIRDAQNSLVLDTGKVWSSSTTYTVPGMLLQPGHTYSWRVVTWSSWTGAEGATSAAGTLSR